MAADSLLPLFHDNTQPLMSSTETDDVLAQLLGDAGEDLLASLLEPDSSCLSQLPPPLSSPPFQTSSDPTLPPLDTVTDNRTVSPALSFSSGSPVGNSPATSSPPGDVMMMSSSMANDELSVLLGSVTSISSGESSSDVRIDLDIGSGYHRDQVTGPSSSSGHKAHTLVLTEEEKQLLSAEGVELPTDMPLTKTEQRHLKKVRRKIKNKLSAQESRRKKKEYVEGLEERVETCTQTNSQLRQKVHSLENENKSLLQQLQKLQSMVSHLYPGKLQTGSLLMVISLCFSLLVWPRPPATPFPYATSVHSRSLLFTDTDEFGNIIDPQSRQIISEQGGQSPLPPYPWSHQTPAYLTPTNKHTSHSIIIS